VKPHINSVEVHPQFCFTMNGIGWSWQLPESIHVVRMRALQWERGSSHHPISPETLAAIATKGSSISFPESSCIQFQASISNPWILECRIFTPIAIEWCNEDHHNLLHDGVLIANTFEGGEETCHLFATLESWNDHFLEPFKDALVAFALCSTLCSQGTYLLQYKLG